MAQIVDQYSLSCRSSGVEHVLGKVLFNRINHVNINIIKQISFLFRIIWYRVASKQWIKIGSLFTVRS